MFIYEVFIYTCDKNIFHFYERSKKKHIFCFYLVFILVIFN
jgi:hypothetical protein